MTALVGASGSGKSTLASLLCRFRCPSEGFIFVDQSDYWKFSPESWHSAVALVDQETFLFNDTLRQNIAYGLPQVSEEQILEAIRIAHLEDVVEGLPDGLETMVGERGVTLSGGQRQRLAIARAVVRDPKILVLDDVALDNISEREVQVALNEASKEGRSLSSPIVCRPFEMPIRSSSSMAAD